VKFAQGTRGQNDEDLIPVDGTVAQAISGKRHVGRRPAHGGVFRIRHFRLDPLLLFRDDGYRRGSNAVITGHTYAFNGPAASFPAALPRLQSSFAAYGVDGAGEVVSAPPLQTLGLGSQSRRLARRNPPREPPKRRARRRSAVTKARTTAYGGSAIGNPPPDRGPPLIRVLSIGLMARLELALLADHKQPAAIRNARRGRESLLFLPPFGVRRDHPEPRLLLSRRHGPAFTDLLDDRQECANCPRRRRCLSSGDAQGYVGKRSPTVVLTYRLRAGLISLITLMIPALGSAQGVAPAGPLGEPTGSFVLFAGGTNVFGSGWGTGTLTFQGQKFSFTADGIQPVTKSESTDLAEGTVFNLVSVNDFSGFYSTVQGFSQAASQYLQNEHYVVIHITQSKKGAMFRTMDKPVRVDLTN